VLCIDNLQVALGRRVLVDALTLRAAGGEMWALLGPNGSGKTSLLHTMVGVLPPRRGQVRIQDADVHQSRAQTLARQVALLPQQEPTSFWGEVRDYVMLARFAHGDEHAPEAQLKVDAALAQLQLTPFARRRLQQLSGGETQRVRIAQTWVQDAPIMCLDEPLQHLDPQHQLSVMQHCAHLVRACHRLIFIVVHDSFWALRHCTHALLLYGDGRVDAGRAEDLITRANLARLYGVDAQHFELVATS
jgi:iron complex transport system ATP-binding protein